MKQKIQQVPAREVERMMKVQQVILKAMAGSLKGCEAAEILGVTDRTMRRWRQRYQEHGYDGLYDYRKGQPSPKRIVYYWRSSRRGALKPPAAEHPRKMLVRPFEFWVWRC